MAKTPEYTKKAIQNYNNKFDRIAVNLPKGTKERIKELTGKSCNAYISELVIKDLETLKGKKAEPSGSQQEEIAWDPDYTKVTPAERAELERAQREIENGETVSHDAINWD